MSLEEIGRHTLRKAIISILDKTHSASLTEILIALPEEVRTCLKAEDREKIVIDILVDMLRNGSIEVLHLKG